MVSEGSRRALPGRLARGISCGLVRRVCRYICRLHLCGKGAFPAAFVFASSGPKAWLWLSSVVTAAS